MVTSGKSRQSSRRASVAGLAASASLSVSRWNTDGMPCAWMAIRLTARSLLSEPSLSTTRPVGRPSRGARLVSTATRSPSCAFALAPGGIASALSSIFLSTGSMPPAAVGRGAENAEHALLGMVDDADDAAASEAVVGPRLDAQQHAVAEPGGFARAAACA